MSKQPHPIAVVRKLALQEDATTVPSDLLAAVTVAQAIDRLTAAVERNTKAIQDGTDSGNEVVAEIFEEDES